MFRHLIHFGAANNWSLIGNRMICRGSKSVNVKVSVRNRPKWYDEGTSRDRKLGYFTIGWIKVFFCFFIRHQQLNSSTKSIIKPIAGRNHSQAIYIRVEFTVIRHLLLFLPHFFVLHHPFSYLTETDVSFIFLLFLNYHIVALIVSL